MTVYIPCYFKDIEDRCINFYKNLKQYLNLNYNVVIYWMNEEFCEIETNNLTIIKGIQSKAGEARNILLDIFYNSNEDYAIFSDDDTFLKDVISIDTKMDCLSLTNDYNKELKNTEKISSAFLILCNFRKKYNLKPYFDKELDSNQDLDFGLNLNRYKIKTYRQSSDIIIINKGTSSMFKNKANMVYRKQQTLKYLINKYKDAKYNF